MFMHRILAEYHRKRASRTSVTVDFNHHDDLAFRLEREADLIQNRIVFEEETNG